MNILSKITESLLNLILTEGFTNSFIALHLYDKHTLWQGFFFVFLVLYMCTYPSGSFSMTSFILTTALCVMYMR